LARVPADPGRIGRLRWLCRRGMKELDILLEAFLAEHQPELEQGAYPELESLLREEDDRLWDWIQSVQAAPRPYRAMVAKLRREP
jgi:antitoxin CptB